MKKSTLALIRKLMKVCEDDNYPVSAIHKAEKKLIEHIDRNYINKDYVVKLD